MKNKQKKINYIFCVCVFFLLQFVLKYVGNWESSDGAGMVTPPVSTAGSCGSESMLSKGRKQSVDALKK